MEYEIVEITKKPSDYSKEETAIITAMQHTLKFLVKDFLDRNPSQENNTDYPTSDIVLMGSTMGTCDIAAEKSLSFLQSSYADLFKEIYIEEVKNPKLFSRHFVVIAKGKSEKYYYFSAANYIPPEEAKLIGDYNRLGSFVRAENLVALKNAINKYETSSEGTKV